MAKHKAQVGLIKEVFLVRRTEDILTVISFPDTPNLNNSRFTSYRTEDKVTLSIFSQSDRSVSATLVMGRIFDLLPPKGRRAKENHGE